MINIDTPIFIGPIATTALELIAVFFGLFSVWFMKKESILAFPFGIINVVGYVYINYIEELYALSGINLFFSMMSIYGWINWSRKVDDQKAVSISRCSRTELIINAGILLVSFIVIRIILKTWTDSPVPTWDAVTTSLYIVAMWLLARKKIENWFAWILGDTISIFLYAMPFNESEVNYFSSFQFAVFTVIAIFGYKEWRLKLNKREANE